MPPSDLAPLLSADQLVELLGLVEQADSVELKLTVDAGTQRKTMLTLGFDPLDAQIRLVHFFDTPDLQLQQAGVVVRARRVQGRPDDTVIKLRPVDPAKVSKKLRKNDEFVVEVDAMPSGYVCSGSLKGEAREEIRPALADGRALRKLFTKEQRAFYAEHAPAGLELEDLVELGPIFVLKLKGQPDGFARKLVAELWLYPDGDRILELSTKCAPEDAIRVTRELRAYLQERDIVAVPGAETKTKKALSFFSAQLAEVDGQAGSAG